MEEFWSRIIFSRKVAKSQSRGEEKNFATYKEDAEKRGFYIRVRDTFNLARKDIKNEKVILNVIGFVCFGLYMCSGRN